METNNIFSTQDTVVAKFVRVPKHGITGLRLNPEDNNRKIEFLLIGSDAGFDYEKDVIEIYSEKELKFFKQANRYLFQNGMLREYEGDIAPVDMTNSITDEEVEAIAMTRTIPQMKSRLAELTSHLTVRRVLVFAQDIGRPKSILDVIQERLDALRS